MTNLVEKIVDNGDDVEKSTVDCWSWPPEGWPDIQQIADSEKDGTYSFVFLFDNNMATLEYNVPTDIINMRTSDGNIYGSGLIKHTWDSSKDINGKYRYIIVSANNNWAWHKHSHAIGIAYSSNYMLGKTSFDGLFQSCYSLYTIPMIDVSSGTSFKYMFQNCYSLSYVPLLDFSNGIDMSYAFAGCRSLRKIPQFDLSSAESLRSFLMSCSNLEEIPLMDTSKCTNFDYFVRECSALRVFPKFDTSSGISFRGIFSYDRALSEIGPINVSQCTNFEAMFQYCSAVASLASFNVSNGTAFTYMFQGCNNLSLLEGDWVFNSSIELDNTILNKDSIVRIFNNLPVTTDQTIKISFYTDGQLEEDDKLIATNKGWVIAVA